MKQMDDIVLIDKPVGWTSFDVVAKIRGKVRAEYVAKGEKPTKKQLRVGHAGTLDPFATGLVIVLIGEACKQAGDFLKLDKTYEFTAKLGEVSSTGDPEGEITEFLAVGKKQKAKSSENVVSRSRKEEDTASDSVILSAVEGSGEAPLQDMNTLPIPTEKQVKTALKQFEGVISQVPPAFSAIKINGKRAYKLAREGKTVEIPARQVTIHKLALVEYNYPYLKCICDVSSGTYIRTLVEDIGKVLKTGAYGQELRRTRISTYTIEDAITISDVIKD